MGPSGFFAALMGMASALVLLLVAMFWKKVWVFAVRHRKLVRAVMFVVIAAIYLNIGWAIGTYYHNYIFGHTPQTFWQTVWKGGYGSLNGGFGKESLLFDQIFLMLVWPMLGFLVPTTWAVYAIHHFAVLAFHSMVFILWLIGAGGIAKLLGIG